MSKRKLIPRRRSVPVIALLCLIFSTNVTLAESGERLVQDRCADCHALVDADQAVGERAKRGGPPLHFSGNKFRSDWLKDWLQNYKRIRSAGIYPAIHTIITEKGDEIDESTLPSHPQLSEKEALLATDYLMSLKSKNALVQEISFEPIDTARQKNKGRLEFTRDNACFGCHQNKPQVGGISAPELYTAWQRLQPAYIVSHITDPAAWDKNTMMPRIDLKPRDIQKLADYLRSLAKEAE